MTTAYLRGDLRRDEGDEPRPYRDSRGIWSIATGHNMEVDPALMARFAELQAHGLTQAEDDALLDADIAAAELRLDVLLPWWRRLDDVRQDVMVNLAFNLGADKLAKWRHTLGDIESGAFRAAGIDLRNDEPWASQVHGRAERLARQMETGVRSWASASEPPHPTEPVMPPDLPTSTVPPADPIQPPAVVNAPPAVHQPLKVPTFAENLWTAYRDRAMAGGSVASLWAAASHPSMAGILVFGGLAVLLALAVGVWAWRKEHHHDAVVQALAAAANPPVISPTPVPISG